MISTGNRICTLIVEIQDAFLNTPDLTLSPTDAVRRFGADRITCEAVLDALVDVRVLMPAKDGVATPRHRRSATQRRDAATPAVYESS